MRKPSLLSLLSALLFVMGCGPVESGAPDSSPDGVDDGIEACTDGETAPAGDGCNTCTCMGGVWACTLMGCQATCPAPAAADPGVNCPAVIAYGKDPASGLCCMYSDPCHVPAGWTQYYSEQECEGACSVGDRMAAPDGCNSCSCTDGGWACTEMACPPPPGSCASDADCFVSGCSGQICASEDVATTCEWLDEYACYKAPTTSCGCQDGFCGWARTPELDMCLNQACSPGDVKPAGDGCNTCSCSPNGVWNCTKMACSMCPAPLPSTTGCPDVLVFARDPQTQLCCEYPDPCSPPIGWDVFYTLDECAGVTNSCIPGANRPAPDGCNTCSCDSAGNWACTEMACVGSCASDADCFTTGCSGQLCAAQDIMTTCEWREEYACYGSPYTSCGCVDGLCGWAQTADLERCLGSIAPPPIP